MKSAAVVAALALLVFCLWWWAWFVYGNFPATEWGYGFLWAEWFDDRFWLLKHGVLPEWDPNLGLGYNAIGFDPFYNPISIGNLFRYLPNISVAWVSGVAIFQLIFAVGTYFFLRAQGISTATATVFAVLITLYPKWMDDFYHGPGRFVGAYSWIPWLLLSLQSAFEGRRVFLNYVLAGIFAALVYLCGGALVTYFLCYLIVPFWGWQFFKTLFRDPGRRRAPWPMAIGGLALVAVIAAGLSAYLLLPEFDMLRLSQRSLYEGPTGYGWIDFLGTVFPWVARQQTFPFLDRPYDVPFLGYNFSNTRFYFGVLAVPLLLFWLGDRNVRKRNVFFMALGLLLVLSNSKFAIATVSLTKLIDNFVAVQPSEYFLFFVYIFCFNTAAAFIADALRERVTGEQRTSMGMAAASGSITILRVVYGAAVLAWVIAWAAVVLFPGVIGRLMAPLLAQRPIELVRLNMAAGALFLSPWFAACVLAGLVARFVLLTLSRRTLHAGAKPRLFVIMAALWIADFLLLTQTYYPFSDANKYRYTPDSAQNRVIRETMTPADRLAAYNPYEKIRLKETALQAAMHDMAAKSGLRFAPRAVVGQLSRINHDLGFWEPLFDAGVSYSPQAFGRASYDFHLSVMPSYFYDFDAAMNDANPRYYRQSWTALWNPSSPLVNIAGIDYVVWYQRLDDPRYQLVGRDPVGDLWIYRNRAALPKAYLVHRAIPVATDAAALAIMQRADFDPHAAVVTGDTAFVHELAAAPSTSDTTATDHVTVATYSALKIVAWVATGSPAALVLTDMYFPHWRATVDGTPTPIVRVNVAFRGIVIPPGEHEVVLIYRNPAFHLGLKISAASAVFAAALLVLGGWLGRSQPPRSPA